MTIKKWWKKTWLGKIRIFLWKTALESYILVGLKMWDSLSFTFKGGSGTGPKPEHILFLRVTSLSHQVSGSAKKKKKTFGLWCSGGPETAHLQVVYLMADRVASDTLCSPISLGSSRCRALRIYLEVRIQPLMERARKEAYLIHPQWYC